MRLKQTWLVAALGLGSLVALIAVSMLASSRRAEEIFAQLDQLNNHHRVVEATLRRLRSDVNLSGIFVRDYLLDVARERAPEYRQRIAEFRETNLATLAELKTLINGDQQIDILQAKLTDYWQTFDPLFDWTPAEKIVKSAAFLRTEVVPRREAALTMAQEIEELNNVNLTAQRSEVARRLAGFRADLHRLLWQTLLFGLGVASVVVLRLRVLERRSEMAEQHMRGLSQQLVNAQEEERKHLSRELHDHVAQMLTGLRMELGRIERISARTGPTVAECKSLVDELFRTVRNLSLGLRPSMLDDFGLQAALEWHVRDFMRRYALDVELNIDGPLVRLPDEYSTCAYRVVQEALTNCVRHAQATLVQIRVHTLEGRLRVLVRDDGIGIDFARRDSGLGLRGIDERVKKLNGSLVITREEGSGTTLLVLLPLPPQATSEMRLARAAS